jgi:hypothetical protein
MLQQEKIKLWQRNIIMISVEGNDTIKGSRFTFYYILRSRESPVPFIIFFDPESLQYQSRRFFFFFFIFFILPAAAATYRRKILLRQRAMLFKLSLSQLFYLFSFILPTGYGNSGSKCGKGFSSKL